MLSICALFSASAAINAFFYKFERVSYAQIAARKQISFTDE